MTNMLPSANLFVYAWSAILPLHTQSTQSPLVWKFPQVTYKYLLISGI